MNIKIEVSENGRQCKVWLDDHAVSFSDVKSAEAYAIKLQERLDAKPEAFTQPTTR